MATFLIKKEKTITRQQGDTSDVTFVFPDVIPPAAYSINFSVWSNASQGDLLFEKDQSQMQIEEQTVTVPISREETSGISGERYWELRIFNEHTSHTIGKGIFKVLKTYGNN